MTTVKGFDFSNFQSRYKYTVLGKADELFRTVAIATEGNERARPSLSSLKARRGEELKAIETIEASGLPTAEKARQIAQAKLPFLEGSLNALKAHINTPNKEDVGFSSTNNSRALKRVLQETEKALEDYIYSRPYGHDFTNDETFQKIEEMMTTADRLLYKTRLNLRQDGRFFDLNNRQGERFITSIRNSIASARAGSRGGVDIEV